MTRCYLIHGFNTRNRGIADVMLLKADLQKAGFEIKPLTYGWVDRITVRVCNHHLADLLADVIKPGSVAVGFSNGCALLQMAAEHGAQFKHLVYIRPALDRDTRVPPQVKRVDVWHSKDDFWTSVARWIPFSRWGDAGAVGLVVPDNRVYNHEQKGSHSHAFDDPDLGKKIVEVLTKE